MNSILYPFVIQNSKCVPFPVGSGVEGADRVVNLDVVPGPIPKDAMSRYPFLHGCTVLKIPKESCDDDEVNWDRNRPSRKFSFTTMTRLEHLNASLSGCPE